MSKINLTINCPQAPISEMKDLLEEQFHTPFIFKALELIRHHARFEHNLPFDSGRSKQMQELQSNEAGQPVDDGSAVEAECLELSAEMALEALGEEQAALADELANEIETIAEESGEGEETDGDDDEADEEARHVEYDESIDDLAASCSALFDAFCASVLTEENSDALIAIAKSDISECKEFVWAYEPTSGTLTFIVSK